MFQGLLLAKSFVEMLLILILLATATARASVSATVNKSLSTPACHGWDTASEKGSLSHLCFSVQ